MLMKVYDGHSDILNDVVTKSLRGESNIIEQYHLAKLQAGEVFASNFVIWVEPEYRRDYKRRTLEI